MVIDLYYTTTIKENVWHSRSHSTGWSQGTGFCTLGIIGIVQLTMFGFNIVCFARFGIHEEQAESRTRAHGRV